MRVFINSLIILVGGNRHAAIGQIFIELIEGRSATAAP
jgi:hypothetical protein